MENEISPGEETGPDLRVINTVLGSSVLGIILKELPDSFLVGLPGKLVRQHVVDGSSGEFLDESLVVQEFVPPSEIRLFKSTLLSMLPLFDDFEYFYLQYLLTEGIEKCPDMISDTDKEILTRRLEDCGYIVAPAEQAAEDPSEREDRGPSPDSFLVLTGDKTRH
jgi:hypothetical protein